MVRPDKITDISDDSSSLWLVIKRGKESSAFEFESDSARIVTVGAAAHADVLLDVPEAAPLVCYFERDGEKIWLVPGYRCKQLRADATLVERPRRLGWRSIVEFSGVTLEVRVREEPPTCPEHGVPTSSYCGRYELPAYEAGHSPISSDLVAFRDDVDDIDDDYPTMVSIPSSRRSARLATRATAVGSSGRGSECETLEGTPIVSIGESAQNALGDTGMERSVYGLYDAVLTRQSGANLETASSYEPISMSPSVISIRAERTPPVPLLAALGEFARRHPVVVLLGASFGAITLMLVMSAIARFAPSKGVSGRDMPPMLAASGSIAPLSSFGHVASSKPNQCNETTHERCVVLEPEMAR